jgi:hypothetical protein
MRKLMLLTFVGAALVMAAPQFASATPAAPATLSVAVDSVSNVDQAHYRWRSGYGHRWHHRHWRHSHCSHCRYWSGRRCSW